MFNTGTTLPSKATTPTNSNSGDATTRNTIAPIGSSWKNQQLKYDDVYVTDVRLRSGSYGTVYTCHHRGGATIDVAAMTTTATTTTTATSSTISTSTATTNEFAVKIIDRAKLKKKDDEGTLREVRILQELIGVPHIIQALDFFVEPQRYLVVQTYAAGGDVFDRLAARQTYSEQDARTLAKVLLQAIYALHKENGGSSSSSSSSAKKPHPIVHRDLKPENLLLANQRDNASILVADFGFARHVPAGQAVCQTRCGTPAFVAPEVVIGIPYGTSVDLWSIGCLLYMLLGGYPPFVGKNHRELFRKIRAADFVFHEAYFGKVSDSAKNLITNLLTVNTAFRWTAQQALESDWFTKESAQNLSQRDLQPAIAELKRFKARRSWRAARVVLKWASTQPFWKPDAVSFAEQMYQWDKDLRTGGGGATTTTTTTTTTAGDGSTIQPSPHSSISSAATLTSVMSAIPKLKFADLYTLDTQIRKGSYAMVWKATHKTTGEVYACKVVQRKGLKPADDEAVMNEVAIMQQLVGKKHFVQLIDFYEEQDAFYLVMEYMSGGDVFDQVVQKTHYTEKTARDLVALLLKAVSTLHDLGIAHRDIKPQNLLLQAGNDHDIKVGDFGFARRVHTPCSLTSRMGTPTYVAPEILKNIPHDNRVDLWSIGVVTFVLLVGYPPFLEDNQSALFEKIRTGEWEFIESDWKPISKEAKEFIVGLLAVDPKERWSVKECMRSAWIKKDPNNLSSIDLSLSLGTIRKRRVRLRSLAKAVMIMGRIDSLHTVSDVPTQANIDLSLT